MTLLVGLPRLATDVAARPRSIVVTCGGTGGHVYPAIAIARELRRLMPDVSLSFVGRADSYESRVLEREGFEMDAVDIGRLAGQSAARRAATLGTLPLAVLRGARILRRRRADLVIGTGGFVSGPVMLAAVALRLPTLVQEQNAVAGLTNGVLRRLADRVAVAHEAATLAGSSARARVTGNPVRPEFFDVPPWTPPAAGEPLDVLVLGGSQGARSLNAAAVGALRPGGPAEDLAGRVRLTLQCGPRWEEEVRAGVAGSAVEPFIAPYLHDVPGRLARAHLVIARSGASTVAEICAAGRPSILVPFPHAAGDHQSANAQALVEAGAARLVPDAELSGESFAALLRGAAQSAGEGGELATQAARARELARPDAAAAIVELALDAFAARRRPSAEGGAP